MKSWMPSELSEPFFGLKRIHEFKAHGFRIIADPFISDYRSRKFFERWFTFPWRPFQYVAHEPIAYILANKGVIVSRDTYKKLGGRFD